MIACPNTKPNICRLYDSPAAMGVLRGLDIGRLQNLLKPAFGILQYTTAVDIRKKKGCVKRGGRANAPPMQHTQGVHATTPGVPVWKRKRKCIDRWERVNADTQHAHRGNGKQLAKGATAAQHDYREYFERRKKLLIDYLHHKPIDDPYPHPYHPPHSIYHRAHIPQVATPIWGFD
jgi:hypothetical protein